MSGTARKVRDSPSRPKRTALSDYGRGPLGLAAPAMIILIIFLYGQVGGLTASQVFGLSLGVSGSMLVATGFMQAISRRGSILISLGNLAAARRFLVLGITTTWLCSALVAILVVLVATGMNLFALSDLIIFALAFLALSLIWLISSGLTLVNAPGWLLVALVAGLVAAFVADWGLGQYAVVDLALGYVGQAFRDITSGWAIPRLPDGLTELKMPSLPENRLIIVTLVGFAGALGVLLGAFRRSFRAGGKGRRDRAVLPPAALLLYEAAPYFAYGSLCFVFILIPHLLGWFGTLGPEEDRMWAIRGLEIALTASMLPVALAGGVAEHAMQLFWRQAAATQASTPGGGTGLFASAVRKFYRRQLLKYLVVVGSTSFVAYAVFQILTKSNFLESQQELSFQGFSFEGLSFQGFPFQGLSVEEFSVTSALHSILLFGANLRSGWEQLPTLDANAILAIPGRTLTYFWQSLYGLDATEFVFDLALIAYWLLGVGLFNCMFSVTLAQPQRALRPLLAAMLVMIAAGVPLSLGLNYTYSALAFVAGSAAFAVTSYWVSTRLLRSADYLYFSSV